MKHINHVLLSFFQAQYKNAVSEAELAKVKAKMILLENADVQRRQYEKRCEDMAQRLRESERHLQAAQKDIANYQVRKLLYFN